MSETGATAEQLHEAIQRKLEAWGVPAEQRNDEWSDYWLASDQVNNVAPVLVPPGYQIVPAGAVTLSAEDTADAAHGLMHAIGSVDEDDDRRIARTDDEWRAVITTWRALAAKLGGGA